MIIPQATKNIVKCASKESTRYAIQSVQVERDGNDCIATVTDGKRLLSFAWTDGTDGDKSDAFRCIIPTPSWNQAHKSATVKANGLATSGIIADETVPTVPLRSPVKGGSYATTPGVPCPDDVQHFPSWRDVVPERGADTFRIAVNAKLLGELLLAMDSAGARIVVLSVSDPSHAMRIDTQEQTGDIDATGVIMPVTIAKD